MCNLPLSIHAGEEHNTGHYDPTDFVKGVLQLPNTVGIGHGVSVGKALLKGKHKSITPTTSGNQFYLDPWLKSVRDKGILFEVCLTSNQSIDSSGPSFEYLDEMMGAHGFTCALGTDDPALFGITLCDEYLKYAEYLWNSCKGFEIELSYILTHILDRLKTLANNSLKYAGKHSLIDANWNLDIDIDIDIDNARRLPPTATNSLSHW